MRVFFFLSLFLFSISMDAKENPFKSNNSRATVHQTKMMNCDPPIAYTEFSLNNVRFGLESGGQLWENNGTAAYEIPKVDVASGELSVHSIYAGGLWLGGFSPDGQLRLAATTFRSQGSTDFFNGPLTTDNNAVAGLCDEYDVHFPSGYQIPQSTDLQGNVTSFRLAGARRLDVARHRAYFDAGNPDLGGSEALQDELFPEGYQTPTYFEDWPGNNYNGDYSFYLAPFKDYDEDGEYNPENGDYPGFDLDNEIDCRNRLRDDPIPLFGDEALWWVYNDNGGIHTETGGEPIGMEIQAQAFAFTTTDDVNNMTFYNYVLINRGTQTLQDTYFGQWCDVDLGCSTDDFVGCDVQRGLGYAYNGDNFDESSCGSAAYGNNPPVIGIDFFEGPYQDDDGLNNPLTTDLDIVNAQDGIPYQGIGLGYQDLDLLAEDPDDPRIDNVIDNERFGMRRFVYYNRGDQTPTPGINGEPNIAADFYNYLNGIWKNGSSMTYGGNAIGGSDSTKYMFTGDSDPVDFATNGVDAGVDWTEVDEENVAGDRRFIQSAGTFQLDPGEFNNVTVGVVWVRPFQDPVSSLDFLRIADDKAQALFDNCFRLLSGPDAPDVDIVELDQEIILYISNENQASNNLREEYGFGQPEQFAFDPLIPSIGCDGQELTLQDKYYEFQGYKVYQLKNSQVSSADLGNSDLARIQFQTDKQDGVGQIINYVDDPNLGLKVPTEAVDGSDEGLEHAFLITEDKFTAEGLVNHKKYYFMVVAYAHNEYSPYNAGTLCGQSTPYLESRKSPTGEIPVVSAIPHKPQFDQGGTQFNSTFGDELQVTRLEGTGNNGTFLELTDESINDILTSPDNVANELVYETGGAPITVKVFDPLKLKDNDFQLFFDYPEGEQVWSGTDLTVDDKIDWYVEKSDGEVVTRSAASIEVGGEYLLLEYGISIELTQSEYTEATGADGTAALQMRTNLIDGSLEFSDSERTWLTGVPDQDGDVEQNWIRSGAFFDEQGLGFSQTCGPNQDCYYYDLEFDQQGLDPSQTFEDILNGIVAPFKLVSPGWTGPSASANWQESTNNEIADLIDADVVWTSDKSLWTRVPVLEIQENQENSRNGAEKLYLRNSLSVDKNGRNQLNGGDINECTMNGTQVFSMEDIEDIVDDDDLDIDDYKRAAYPAVNPVDVSLDDLVGLSYGMGWFPGYAIDVGSGERLNMAFGENSFLPAENGADMIWNPTRNIYSPNLSTDIFRDPSTAKFGGMHYIYVFRNELRKVGGDDRFIPQYDNANYLFDNVDGSNSQRGRIFQGCAWVMLPLLAEEFELLPIEDGLIPTETTMKLRIVKPFERYAPYSGLNEFYPGSDDIIGDFPYMSFESESGLYDPEDFDQGDFPDAPGPAQDFSINEWLPTYAFSTDGLGSSRDVTSLLNESLDLMNVVPNPYYAYSEYENTGLDNVVKIINLPERCDIRIYNTAGSLIRTFSKDSPDASVEWDLRNERNVPISGGVYIVHIEVPGVGETIVKWFGALRPTDITTF